MTINNTLCWPVCFILILLTSTVASVNAEEAIHQYRILGLFDGDRESDLGKVIAQLSNIELVNVDFKTGSATLRYDANKLFPGKKSEQQFQRLNQRILQLSRSTFEITVPTGLSRSKLSRIEIDIVGLDCKGCSYAAYLAVHKIKGVENATASFKDGKVVAWIDQTVTSRDILIEALEKKGVLIVKK